MPFDLEAIINAVGYPGLALMVFAETGLLIGFFLPGDTLLVTTGLLIQRGHLSLFGESGLWFTIPLLIVAAVVGDATGYLIGRQAGPRLFQREESRLFKRSHLDRAKQFYDRHGGKTIVLARFLAIIRTFAPTVAGAAEMPYPKFAFYNVIGAVGWVPAMLLLGYYVGKAVPNLEVVFTGLVAVMVVVSVAPALWHLWRTRRARPSSG